MRFRKLRKTLEFFEKDRDIQEIRKLVRYANDIAQGKGEGSKYKTGWSQLLAQRDGEEHLKHDEVGLDRKDMNQKVLYLLYEFCKACLDNYESVTITDPLRGKRNIHFQNLTRYKILGELHGAIEDVRKRRAKTKDFDSFDLLCENERIYKGFYARVTLGAI
jgi:hypothetical protein